MIFSEIIEKYWNEFYNFKSVSSLCKAIDRQLNKNKHAPNIEVFTKPFKNMNYKNVKTC